MPNSKRILVVDDSQINRTIVHKILADTYTVIEAENGRRALDCLEKDPDSIDAVLLDLIMPEMNGFVFLQKMRASHRYDTIPVIVMTTAGGEEDEMKALELGANDYVVKPYKPAFILHRLHNILELRQASILRNTVERDPLTGLYNRETFYRKAHTLINEHPEQAYQIILADIERFKIINDLYGLEEDDKLILYTANLLSESIDHSTSLCAHFAGDQYALCVPRQEQYAQHGTLTVRQSLRSFPLDMNLIISFASMM